MGDAGSKEGDRVPLDRPKSSKIHRSAWTQQGSRSDATVNQRSKRWREKSRKLAMKGVRPFRRGRQWEKASPTESSNVRWGSLLARQERRKPRFGARVPPDASKLSWLVEFAAYLMNRCDVGSDGQTPLQRLHGRRDNTPILVFGEKILHKPAKSARGGKWEPRFHSGEFVGMLNFVVSGSGCYRARKGDQDTHGQHQKSPRVGKMGCRRNIESASPPLVSRWQRQRSRHPSRNGEARGDGASSPRRRADGEQGGENVPSQSGLRAVGSQGGRSRVPIPEDWPGTTISSH